MRSGLYTGAVVHERLRPKRHRLSYRVFSLLIDLDELPVLDQRFRRLLGINRYGLFSFRERDHGDGHGPLRDWVRCQLEAAGIGDDGGRVSVLCYPRVLGIVFNPLSVYFCHRRDGTLAGILYEVHNTHGERHTYVMAAEDGPVVRHATAKRFFVSPFMPMACLYRFRVLPPAERVGISILEDDADGLLLTASFTGDRTELSRAALLRVFARYPLMSLKVIAGIHYEALKLLFKGLKIFDWRPAARRIDVSTKAAPAAEAVGDRHGARPTA